MSFYIKWKIQLTKHTIMTIDIYACVYIYRENTHVTLSCVCIIIYSHRIMKQGVIFKLFMIGKYNSFY